MNIQSISISPPWHFAASSPSKNPRFPLRQAHIAAGVWPAAAGTARIGSRRLCQVVLGEPLASPEPECVPALVGALDRFGAIGAAGNL